MRTHYHSAHEFIGHDLAASRKSQRRLTLLTLSHLTGQCPLAAVGISGKTTKFCRDLGDQWFIWPQVCLVAVVGINVLLVFLSKHDMKCHFFNG
jgi:hypothetical protein